MEHTVHFISLGPGDPELITCKGLRLLREADLVFCPATASERGESSRAAEILRALAISDEAIQPFLLPMRQEREGAMAAYDRLFERALAAFEAGKRVAIVAEGDAGFYTSIQYLYDRFAERGVPVERVAGVPAFIAAGAMAGLHIVKQEESLVVLPGIATRAELERYIEAGKVVVLMKLSRCRDEVISCMRANQARASFHYFEQVGTPHAYYSHDPLEIQSRPFPYFSLMIVRPDVS